MGGTLKPGATYIYERANGTIYAREFDAHPSTRQVVGYENGTEYDPISGHRIDYSQSLHDQIREDRLWGKIRHAAETNPALQEAMDRVKIIYQLSKPDE